MKRAVVCLAILVSGVVAGVSRAQEDVLGRIRQEALDRSQEYKDYDVRTHHTNVDLYERVREQDLKQNAIVMAWFAWQAANTAERIPRP